jgi:hypothetical protein
MSETQKAARFNITIPADLKARMEDVSTAENWSALAARAFEQRLLELDSQKEAKTMNEVIARLRVADKLDSNEDYRAGYAAGERWAKEDARPRQLRNLKRSMDESSRTLPHGFANVAHDAALGVGPGVGWHVYFGMLGRNGPVTNWTDVNSISSDAETFWSGLLRTDRHRIESASFGQGFVDGALAVWARVESSLAPPVEVTFPAIKPEVAADSDVVVFIAEVDERPVRCRISAEALVWFEDNLGRMDAKTIEPKTMLRRFNAAKERIQEVARKMILDGRAKTDDGLLITSGDVTRSRRTP